MSSNQKQAAVSRGPTAGITFRETMAGGFSLDETDPRVGEQKGKDAGTVLSMRAAISIPDLRGFISDPDHAGSITGHVSFAPMAENIPAQGGQFCLFSPTDDRQLKLMIYELAFEHAGRDYYLAGKKEVRDDPGFDLWIDTTTLYARLHEGADKTGPVVGAGTLRLTPAALLRSASTMRVTSATSAMEQARVLADFGRFFMGELWDTYAKHAAVVTRWWGRWWRRLHRSG